MGNRISDFDCNNYDSSGLKDQRFSALVDGIERLLHSANNKTVIAAIDGRCASGKTTLSKYLKKEYDCNVFHMDDFFLRPVQRTEKRMNTPGENVDHERFLEEVLLPLVHDRDVMLRRYNCQKQSLEDPVKIPHKRLNIVEGVYSLHPKLYDCYDLTAFCDISPDEQRERIRIRNTAEIAERFFSIWIPLEERYFNELDVRNKADILI